jgi:hypothetical protein
MMIKQYIKDAFWMVNIVECNSLRVHNKSLLIYCNSDQLHVLLWNIYFSESQPT